MRGKVLGRNEITHEIGGTGMKGSAIRQLFHDLRHKKAGVEIHSTAEIAEDTKVSDAEQGGSFPVS